MRSHLNWPDARIIAQILPNIIEAVLELPLLGKPARVLRSDFGR